MSLTPDLTRLLWMQPSLIFEAPQDLYAGLHRAVSRLPVPGKVDPKGLSLHATMEAGMLPPMNDEEPRRFTSSEVLLYQHAQVHRYI